MDNDNTNYIYLFTDASSFNNGRKDPSKPMYGGFGCYITDTEFNTLYSIKRSFHDSTINQNELLAVIYGIAHIMRDNYKNGNKEKFNISVVSDSQYVIRGITEYMTGWINRNWMSSSGTPVKNAEMWKLLVNIINNSSSQYEFNFTWVKGHTTNSFKKGTSKRNRYIPEELLPHFIEYNHRFDNLALEV
ncbi:ribonuclease HI [Listeria phage LPJP1]|nr:ribonuclease HI [Listeria phage LPJP1]